MCLAPFDVSCIRERVGDTLATIERSRVASYDPYDGLSSRGLFACTRRWPVLARTAIASVRLCPVNIRPILGISRTVDDPKVLADLIVAQLLLSSKVGQEEEGLSLAIGYADRLMARRASSRVGPSWGLSFPYVSRYTVSVGVPNLFTTANAAYALAELNLRLKSDDLGELLEGTCEFMVRELGYVSESRRSGFLRYYPGLDVPIYNVNALALKFLGAHVAGYPDSAYACYANALARFLVGRQCADGAWTYSDGPKGQWVDGFHTGYVIEGLVDAWSRTHDPILRAAIDRAGDYYLARLFEDNFPLSRVHRRRPIDSQNCAQAIQTRCYLATVGLDDVDSILEMAGRIDEALYSARLGCYAYRRVWRGPRGPVFFRWSLTPMAVALCHLLRLAS